MGKLLVKDDVDFGTVLAPSGARLLEVLKQLVAGYPFDLMITSARDGVHSGPADPHHTGEAFDLRTHGLSTGQAAQIVMDLNQTLGPRFYVFLEAPGLPNEHIHAQRAKGTTYSVLDYLTNR